MHFFATLRDWFILVVGIIAVIVGLFIAIYAGDKSGFAIAAFFAGVAAVGGWRILNGRRLRTSMQADKIEVIGGVPLKPNRKLPIVTAIGFLIIGIIGVLAGHSIGIMFVILTGIIAFFSLLFLVLLLARVLPRNHYLIFEANGLRFGRKHYSFLIEWENIAGLNAAHLNGNDVLLFVVADIEALISSIQCTGSKEDLAQKIKKQIKNNQIWLGGDIAITPAAYGADIALFLRAIERYLTDKRAREFLKKQERIGDEGN
ncbi:MAG: hypothetical protein JW841_12990 [Deltaproteobacteria bacterium]|nr:hypothetical protein [Deltaproteobacteria bacterium]